MTLNTARNQVETTSKDSIFLDKLLIECMSEFQFLIEQERRDVHLQVIPESARIEGDYAKLSRILVNLVDNALNILLQEPSWKWWLSWRRTSFQSV